MKTTDNQYSTADTLRITLRLAEMGHPNSCAKLLSRVTDLLKEGEAVPDEVLAYVGEALKRLADKPDEARRFLNPKRRVGRRKNDVEQMEVYLKIQDLRQKYPDEPLLPSRVSEGLFSRYSDEVSQSDSQIKDMYYKGEKTFKLLIQKEFWRRQKFNPPPELENARQDE